MTAGFSLNPLSPYNALIDPFKGTLIVPLVPGGSWVVISGVISKVTVLITLIRGLITPLITTHEPPSRVSGFRTAGFTPNLQTLNP